MKLHNKQDKRILKQQLAESTDPRTTISFYQYAKLGNPQLFRDHLFLELDPLEVYGRVHVAKEGINAQISVPDKNLKAFIEVMDSITFLKGIRLNYAVEDDGKSFYKLKIKVRDKILADGLSDDTFDVTKKGQHLSAEEWNALMDDPDSIMIDMRNHYETEVGHFKGAVTPDVDTFASSLSIIDDMLETHKDKKIMMYCTGGIRCEKASAWYRHRGYDQVYQLEGGIIKYARDIEEEGLENKFRGKNFVFDERLGERISHEVISNCHQCGKPCDTHTNCSNLGCNLLFIQCEECKAKMDNCCSSECQEIVKLPEEEQRAYRKGKNKGQNIFKKGRSIVLQFKKEAHTEVPDK